MKTPSGGLPKGSVPTSYPLVDDIGSPSPSRRALVTGGQALTVPCYAFGMALPRSASMASLTTGKKSGARKRMSSNSRSSSLIHSVAHKRYGAGSGSVRTNGTSLLSRCRITSCCHHASHSRGWRQPVLRQKDEVQGFAYGRLSHSDTSRLRSFQACFRLGTLTPVVVKKRCETPPLARGKGRFMRRALTPSARRVAPASPA